MLSDRYCYQCPMLHVRVGADNVRVYSCRERAGSVLGMGSGASGPGDDPIPICDQHEYELRRGRLPFGEEVRVLSEKRLRQIEHLIVYGDSDPQVQKVFNELLVGYRGLRAALEAALDTLGDAYSGKELSTKMGDDLNMVLEWKDRQRYVLDMGWNALGKGREEV